MNPQQAPSRFVYHFESRYSRDPPRTYQRPMEKAHHDLGALQYHWFRVTCPRRRERKGERFDIACGWWLIDFEAWPIHLTLSNSLDTNRSCRTVTFGARTARISSIDRSPKPFVPRFFDDAFITLATALNRPVSVRSRETKAVCHYKCSLLVELSGTS